MLICSTFSRVLQSHLRQSENILPKPKWFCVNNEMLQKYQYELDQHLDSIPVSECMCDHMHDNYKYQTQILHDHLIHSCMLAAERTIHFTKPHTKQNRNKAGWNEHVRKEFDHALHWHRLYLQMADRNLVISLK